MANVQAAASLFGVEDSEDPFATLGSPPAGEEPHASQAGDVVMNGSADNGASFFDDLGDPGATVPRGHTITEPAPPSQDTYAYRKSYHAYSDHQQPYAGPATAPQRQASASYGTTPKHEQQNAYDPYVPTTASSSMQPNQLQSQPTSPYNYNPASAIQQSFSSYAPPLPPPPTTAPYAPVTTSYRNTQPLPDPNPKPSVQAVTRPKVANAYDPPFPVKTVRRTASRGPPPQVYNPYAATTSPPPPVPPLPHALSRPSSSASNFSQPYGHPPPTTSGFGAPPPRPPSSVSSYGRGPYSAPPRPPSTSTNAGAQYGQSVHPARPTSGASDYGSYSHPLPPRPSSTASNYSAYNAPHRPPSAASQYGPPPPIATPPPPSHPISPAQSDEPGPILSPPIAPPMASGHPIEPIAEIVAHDNAASDDLDPEGGADWMAEDPRALSPHSAEEAAASPNNGKPVDFPYSATNGIIQDDNGNSQHAPKRTSSPTVIRGRESPFQTARGTTAPELHSHASPSVETSLPPPPAANGHPVSSYGPSPYSYSASSPSVASHSIVAQISASPYNHPPTIGGRVASPLTGGSATNTRYRSTSAASTSKTTSECSILPPPPPPPAAPADPYAPRRQTSGGHVVVDNVYSVGYGKPPLGMTPPNLYLPGSGPAQPPPHLDETRGRTGPRPNGTVWPAHPEEPYTPSSVYNRRQTTETDHGPYTSRYDTPNTAGLGLSQELTLPVRAPYAPSPSLMGTNDPLGRAGVKVPIISFGFGGKIVTCFHGATTMSTGFDVALSSRVSTSIDIRILNKIVPESALDTTAAFPGPLFGDSGSGPMNIVRPGAASQAKTRKTKVIGYLSDRIAEITQGLGYLNAGSLEKRRADGKLVLVKLLKIMVENDGKLSGTHEIDFNVRGALVPRLEDISDDSATAGFVPIQRVGISSVVATNDNDVIATTTLHASALDKIQDYLIRGQKKQAYNFALDQQLWAHAMVIASGIDRESWQEVVKEFVKTDLGSKNDPARQALQSQSTEPISPSVNGREGLRAVYGLLTGQGAASVQELVPQNLLARAAQSLAAPKHQITPLTPHFSVATSSSGSVPADALSDWAETASMMISPTITSEISQTLLALGDQLYTNHWVEAAHVCYLLASPTLSAGGGLSLPPIGGIGHPNTRMVLTGSRNPQTFPIFLRDPDPIIFTEILEFALSLSTPAKGQDPFSGLPHLQAYRLIRASHLVELGFLAEATRYCEAITLTLAKPSPYFNETLIASLKDLSERLHGVSTSDKNGSWMGSKITKPSLDSIGGWLVNKLVTGDQDSPALPFEETAKPDAPGFSNAFSQYSTISSAAPSTSPSPQNSVVNLGLTHGSTIASRPPERSSSAMDNRRKQAAHVPRVASASAATTSFSQAYNSYQNGYHPMSTMTEIETPKTAENDGDGGEGQEVTWWGDIGANRTPTASNFLRAEDVQFQQTSDGFLSPMVNVPFSPAVTSSMQSSSSNIHHEDEEDLEDLGFGNSKSRPKGPDEDMKPYDPGNESPASPSDSSKEEEITAKAPQRPEAKPSQNSSTSGGSWLSRFWKKDASTPGPVKASLGEETSFYYDPELKKWVNKKSGGDQSAKAAPPPPPSRPQTASPGMTGPRQGNGASQGPLPPARTASAINLTSPPKRPASRIRSSLAATPEIESTLPYISAPNTPPPPPGRTPPPPGNGLRPPPSPLPGRPKSAASKRNVRSRYVDVFAQEGGGA